MNRVVSLSVAALAFCTLVGCDSVEEAGDVARSCGKQECPVGTTFQEKRSFSGGTDVSAGFGMVSGDISGAFASFGEGDCEYICQVIQDCPPDRTFPIITQACFTCGVILDNDTVDRGECE